MIKVWLIIFIIIATIAIIAAVYGIIRSRIESRKTVKDPETRYLNMLSRSERREWARNQLKQQEEDRELAQQDRYNDVLKSLGNPLLRKETT